MPELETLEECLGRIHNYFAQPADKHAGTFEIVSGALFADFLLPGQYFRIVGSVLNDGVYKYPATELADETFTGQVWAMSVPAQVIRIVQKISAYDAEHVETGKASESFGGYSYTASKGETGAALTGWDVYGKKLNQWRKLS